MIRSLIGRGLAALAALSCAFASPALASSITVKDGNSTSQTIGTTTRSSDSALIYNMDTVVQGSTTDSGALVGTTAVTLIPASTTRRGFSIQIQTPGVTCYWNGSATATQDYHSLMMVSPSAANGGTGAYYESKDSHVGTGAISMICSAASTSVYARSW